MTLTNRSVYTPNIPGTTDKVTLTVSDFHFELEVLYDHRGRNFLERLTFTRDPEYPHASQERLECRVIEPEGEATRCRGWDRAHEHLSKVAQEDPRLPDLINLYHRRRTPASQAEQLQSAIRYSQWFLF